MKYLYFVRDKISERVYEVFIGETDASSVRDRLQDLARVKPVNDIEVVKAYEIDECEIHSSPIVGDWIGSLVSFDKYKFSESESKAISQTDYQRQLDMFNKSQEIRLLALKEELEKARARNDASSAQ